MRSRRVVCLLLVLTVSGAIAAAEADEPAPNGEPVPLFTNEDLEKYGPSDAPDRPVADTVADGNQDWTFVDRFIEGQYERIETEREHALRVSERDTRASEPEWDGWSGQLLLAPRSPFWWCSRYRAPVHATPYDEYGIRNRSYGWPTGPSARAGRPISSGHYVSRRGGEGASRGGGHGRGSGGGGGGGGKGR